MYHLKETNIMKTPIKKQILCTVIIILLTAILLFFSKNYKNQNYTVTNNGFFFDTFVTITIFDHDISKKENYENLLIQAINMCSEYEKLFSYTLKDSELYTINHSSNNNVHISVKMYDILEKSIYYTSLTNGAFNIYLGELWEMWDFNKHQIPSEEAIVTSLKKLKTNTPTLLESSLEYYTSTDKPYIHLGAIAKGYIADEIKDFLIKHGVTSGIINLGGNVLTIGEKISGEKYRIAITKPFAQSESIAYVDVDDYSVVTSGIYERYFQKNDRIYHHIINPNTGYPVENNLNSVTIIAKSSTAADALSTGIFVLGLDKGLDLINSLNDIYAIFIDKNNNIILSDGLTIDSKNIITIK